MDDTGGVDKDAVVYEGDLEFAAFQRRQRCAIKVFDAVGKVGAVVHGAITDDDMVFEETGQVIARNGRKGRADVLEGWIVGSENGHVTGDIDGIGERCSRECAVGRGKVELRSREAKVDWRYENRIDDMEDAIVEGKVL